MVRLATALLVLFHILQGTAAPHRPIVIAHRGASGHLPEHTLEAYRLAVEMGADYIEPDLVSTKDGVLIARHEHELGETTDVAARFPDRRRMKTVDGRQVPVWLSEDFTLEEIRQLRTRERLTSRSHAHDGKFSVPTFDEVIALAKELGKARGRAVGIYPETKHPSHFQSIGLPLEPALLASLEKAGWNRQDAPVFIQSFETANLKALRQLTRVRLVHLVSSAEQVSEAALQAMTAFADGVGAEKRLVQPIEKDGSLGPATNLVSRAHALKLFVHVWTLRSDREFLPAGYRGDPAAEVRRFRELGVDGFFTDFPDVGVRALAESSSGTKIRIVPPTGIIIAAGQRFDLRVEATTPGAVSERPPLGLEVLINGENITGRNQLDVGEGSEPGAGGTGKSSGPPLREVVNAPPNTTNFLVQDYSFSNPGVYTILARTSDGASARSTVTVEAWNSAIDGRPRAKNVIMLVGDGMGASHRTAARIVSRGVTAGRANAPLAMDRMPVTGLVMTGSLNSIITDSSPGMGAYVTGHKSNNNQGGVYPDNTTYAFDNPRVEYLGELLRRLRGPGFRVGLVTTSDVTDSTPASNAVHTAERSAGMEIASRYFDERESNGVSVLLGGGRGNFLPEELRGRRTDERDVVSEFKAAGFAYVSTATEMKALGSQPPPRMLGLFHPGHMSVAFDKVGAGKYSDELALPANAALRDQPMLEDMTRLALASLSKHATQGFYLMVEGASIDKQAHAADAERAVWDTIEFDNAVAVALEFAERTNTDSDLDNDTLVIVTADHETGGMGIIGVGNPKYAPEVLGKAVREYAAVLRFTPSAAINFFPDYRVDAAGFPLDPDPPRKLLIGWAVAPDRFENWLSNRLALPPAYDPIVVGDAGVSRGSIANPARDGAEAGSDNASARGVRIPGFLVNGIIENGSMACETCADTSLGLLMAGHTASDIPLSAYGPGMEQFTGTYDNTDVFLKILRAVSGSYDIGLRLAPGRR